MEKFLRKTLMSEYFVLYLIILYLLVLFPFIPGVFNPLNLANIMSNTWPLLAVAIGQTFVLIVAGIDLSQTSVMALSSVMGALVMTSHVNPILFDKSPVWGFLVTEQGGILSGSPLVVPVGILVMLAVGILIGLINGFSVAYFKMPPFIVTLVTMMLFSAVAIYLPKSENITHMPDLFIKLGKGNISIIPIAMIITLTLALIAHFTLSKSLFGRRLYATGINEKAAGISGISTKKIIITAYVISGLCAAVASILYSARLEMGRPTLGNTLLLDIIGANVIGGISLAGGKGKITWTILGVLFFIVLSNTLSLLNLSFYMIDAVKGSVILIASVLNIMRSKSNGEIK